MSYKIDGSGHLTLGGKKVRLVKSPNVGGALKPKILVIHYTASGPGSDIAEYFKKKEAKVSAHLVIRRDGAVAQCVSFDTVGWHAGKSRWKIGNTVFSGLNQSSIGIEIENWGPLKKTGAGWISWTGAPVDGAHVIEAKHKFGSPECGWETFTSAQVEATIAVSQAICAHYGITEIVGHDDISYPNKVDPGPAWNMASFKARVLGRADDDAPHFVVNSAMGLNIRVGPSVSADPVRPNPLPDGTRVLVHEAAGVWRFVSVLNAQGEPDFSGWVHGAFLVEA